MTLQQTFDALKTRDEAALITYAMAGFPAMERSMECLQAMCDGGADMIEIGVPFSDPVADGPVIQNAGAEALRRGTNISAIFKAVRLLRTDRALIMMSSINPLLAFGAKACGTKAFGTKAFGTKAFGTKAFGTKAFGTKAFGMKRLFPEMKESGFSGLIVPDLPIEEAGPWSEEAERNAVSLIFLATPVSQKKRLRLIASRTRGFVYCVSLTGITGVRDEVPQGLPEFLARVRSVTKKPLAVGFGISTPDQVRRIAPVADGVIVGSRLVEAVRKGEDVQALVRNLKKATRRQHTMTID